MQYYTGGRLNVGKAGSWKLRAESRKAGIKKAGSGKAGSKNAGSERWK